MGKHWARVFTASLRVRSDGLSSVLIPCFSRVLPVPNQSEMCWVYQRHSWLSSDLLMIIDDMLNTYAHLCVRMKWCDDKLKAWRSFKQQVVRAELDYRSAAKTANRSFTLPAKPTCAPIPLH